MKPFRDEIEGLEQNGITRVAFKRMGDPKVIPLWFGEGDVPTPAFIREAAKRALDEGQTFYSHTRGRPELRAALKTYLDGLYGIDLDERRITVPGAAMLGVTIAAQMVLTSGGHGLIVGPVWPNIDAVFRVTGADISHVRQRLGDNGWQLSADEIIAGVRPQTRAIFVNSPCNPTGWVMNAEEQRKLLEFARRERVLIIADEVYHRTVFDGDHAPSFLTLAEEDDPVVVVNGFSKAWAMTGWRIGWVVTPTTNVFSQLGAVAALRDGEDFVRAQQRQFKAGRALVDQAFADHPLFDYVSPAGAFYAFPRIRGCSDSLAFAEGLLAEEDVGVAPGYTFGPDNDAHFRICFAQSLERLEEGLARIVRYTERHYG
jgi:aspartate/methionine/tyrosine aminotransferase